MLTIRRAAVIGAGTMGAQIAAHLANVGLPVVLLDVPPTELTPEEQQRGFTLADRDVRNRVTRSLFERAKKLSPNPFFTPAAAKLVTLGNIEDDLPGVRDADWIIEAVLERMDLKRDIHARLAAHARPDALVTTNTSGLSLNAMAAELPLERRRRFFGTHFFNPPRHMRLLELVPTADTDHALLAQFAAFAEERLGKGVVRAKDTPGFVANRIGCFALQHVLWLTVETGLGFDEVDALTGAAMGRPKSGTFRLADIVGVDLLAQIARNLGAELAHDEQAAVFRLPEFVGEMVQRGWWGEKKGQGFYQRVKGAKGSDVLVLDPATMTYRARRDVAFPSLAAVVKTADPAARLRALCAAGDAAGAFAWKHLSAVLCYAANRVPEIADDIVTVDRALCWGFNWELGPFEIWDALGVRETAARLEAEGRAVPALVRDLLAAGRSAFYESRRGHTWFFDPAKRDHAAVPTAPQAISLALLRQAGRVVRGNAGASLVDLGDGVACLEFHTKMNVLGPEQLALWDEALEEVRRNFAGLVIGNQGEHFCAGANLAHLAAQIQRQDWAAIDASIRVFQHATGALRQLPKPVIVACHGYTLGGGCEVALGADGVVAAAETYAGLPEVGVGLIPAAGGTKEMLLRCTEHLPRTAGTEFLPGVQQAWETLGLARISTSAAEAEQLKYLRASETTIVLNRDWLLGAAKARVLALAAGYAPRPPVTDLPALGAAGVAQFKMALHQMRVAGQISEHDRHLGERLAHVLCGGDLSTLHFVSEQYVLDLEREVFLSLCGEPKTLARIEHLLKTGKPLRN